MLATYNDSIRVSLHTKKKSALGWNDAPHLSYIGVDWNINLPTFSGNVLCWISIVQCSKVASLGLRFEWNATCTSI